MDRWFYSTLYWAYDYPCWLKLIHVSKRGLRRDKSWLAVNHTPPCSCFSDNFVFPVLRNLKIIASSLLHQVLIKCQRIFSHPAAFIECIIVLLWWQVLMRETVVEAWLRDFLDSLLRLCGGSSVERLDFLACHLAHGLDASYITDHLQDTLGVRYVDGYPWWSQDKIRYRWFNAEEM